MKIYYQMTYLSKYQSKDCQFALKEINAISNGICFRCGSKAKQECSVCCELGKLTQDTKLYNYHEALIFDEFIDQTSELNLTENQKLCSDKLISCYENKTDILVWAVCGAGKTEITFGIIKSALIDKKAVCFAIPRIDIIYDVYERLSDFFKGVKIGILNSYEPICDAQIYVMTTNQLLKFKNCFGLCIVDEVDAFPFCDNKKFEYAVKSALLEDGIRVYLTSTPTKEQKIQLSETFVLNRRWHGYDLPVPKLKFYNSILLKKKLIPPFLIKKMYKSKRQQLWFVSNREIAQKLSKKLSYFKRRVKYVHSLHENRLSVVKDFKNNKIDILITTTILERGVTFDDVDVVVLDASSPLYTKSALIQIAGRVNRKPQFQSGEVLFCYDELTKIIKESISEIKSLNKMDL